MSLTIEKPAKGRLLIAEPFLGDPNFERTVILITDHDDNGTVGFVLNKPTELHIEQLLENFPEYDKNVFYGGPVQHNNLFYLHTKGDLIPGSEEILPGVFWGGKLGAVKEMLTNGLLSTDDIKFFLGYSGWGKTQLKAEIEEKSWLVVKTNIDVLHFDAKTLWKELIMEMGGDYVLWANAPSDPMLN